MKNQWQHRVFCSKWFIIYLATVSFSFIMPQRTNAAPKEWTAVVKIMDRQCNGVSITTGMKDYKASLQTLVRIATSNTVIERSINTLSQWGISIEPSKLMMGLRIEPDSGSGILLIKVTSSDSDEAKSAADVVAAEFNRYCRELVSEPLEERQVSLKHDLKEARTNLEAAVETRKRGNAGKSAEVLKADVDAAAEIYRKLQVKLAETSYEVEQAKRISPLQVIDSAYLYQVQPRVLIWGRAMGYLLIACGIGLVIGTLFGWWLHRRISRKSPA